jgi:hypothetical protein
MLVDGDAASHWDDHVFPTVAALSAGRIMSSWLDYRNDVTNDTNYAFRTSTLHAIEGGGSLTASEGLAWPSPSVGTFAPDPVWYGDVNRPANAIIHAHFFEEMRTPTTHVSPAARIASPFAQY